MLGLQLSPHFNKPWLSNSFASWWNKRWAGGPGSVAAAVGRGIMGCEMAGRDHRTCPSLEGHGSILPAAARHAARAWQAMVSTPAPPAGGTWRPATRCACWHSTQSSRVRGRRTPCHIWGHCCAVHSALIDGIAEQLVSRSLYPGLVYRNRRACGDPCLHPQAADQRTASLNPRDTSIILHYCRPADLQPQGVHCPHPRPPAARQCGLLCHLGRCA